MDKNAVAVVRTNSHCKQEVGWSCGGCPHNSLIAKLYAYGLNQETTTFFYSYLKISGQRVRIDDILSSLQVLISGVPQWPILGLILFNIFLNDLLEVLKYSNIYNFADDNTISVASKNRDTLLETLKLVSAIFYFFHQMIALQKL